MIKKDDLLAIYEYLEEYKQETDHEKRVVRRLLDNSDIFERGALRCDESTVALLQERFDDIERLQQLIQEQIDNAE